MFVTTRIIVTYSEPYRDYMEMKHLFCSGTGDGQFGMINIATGNCE